MILKEVFIMGLAEEIIKQLQSLEGKKIIESFLSEEVRKNEKAKDMVSNLDYINWMKKFSSQYPTTIYNDEIWFSGITKVSEQDKEKLHYNSIGGLKTVIKNGGEIPRETIERAHRIGIDLKRKESNMDTKENRSLKSKDLELLAQVYQALYEGGLIVSSELIDKNIEDILKASNSELELTKIVMTHIQTLRSSYGDQASYLKAYADAIGSGIEKAVVKKI